MIGNKIRQIREAKKYSQEYIATKLNISQNAYSKIENNQTKLTLERLKEIAKALDTTELELIQNDFPVINFTNNKTAKGYARVENVYEESENLKTIIEVLQKQLIEKDNQINQLILLLKK